jgi:hypothetical protein
LISFDVSVGTVRAGVGYSPPTCTHLAGTEGCTLHMSPWSCVRMRCRQNGPSQGDRLVGYLAAGRCPDYSDISSGEARAWRTWVFGSRWWWTACSVPSSGPQPPGSTYLPHIDHEMVIIDPKRQRRGGRSGSVKGLKRQRRRPGNAKLHSRSGNAETVKWKRQRAEAATPKFQKRQTSMVEATRGKPDAPKRQRSGAKAQPDAEAPAEPRPQLTRRREGERTKGRQRGSDAKATASDGSSIWAATPRTKERHERLPTRFRGNVTWMRARDQSFPAEALTTWKRDAETAMPR